MTLPNRLYALVLIATLVFLQGCATPMEMAQKADQDGGLQNYAAADSLNTSDEGGNYALATKYYKRYLSYLEDKARWTDDDSVRKFGALNKLGIIYFEGQGNQPKDLEQGARFINEASKAQQPALNRATAKGREFDTWLIWAQENKYYLGLINQYGIGKQRDPSAAKSFFKYAAKKHYSRSELSDINKKALVAYQTVDQVEAKIRKSLSDRKAAAAAKDKRKADAAAKAEMKRLYDNASTDDAKGQYQLGLAFYWGKLVEKDLKLASLWFFKAAEQKYAPAESSYAYIHLKGYGVTQNMETALKYYKRAAAGGDKEAINFLETRAAMATYQKNRAKLSKQIMAAKPNWDKGTEYTYYDGSSCKEKQGTFCMNEAEYRKACNSVETYSSQVPGVAALYAGKKKHGDLFRQGFVSDWSSKWSGSACFLTLTASGIVDGNSFRKSLTGKVVQFGVFDSGSFGVMHASDWYY